MPYVAADHMYGVTRICGCQPNQRATYQTGDPAPSFYQAGTNRSIHAYKYEPPGSHTFAAYAMRQAAMWHAWAQISHPQHSGNTDTSAAALLSTGTNNRTTQGHRASMSRLHDHWPAKRLPLNRLLFLPTRRSTLPARAVTPIHPVQLHPLRQHHTLEASAALSPAGEIKLPHTGT